MELLLLLFAETIGVLRRRRGDCLLLAYRWYLHEYRNLTEHHSKGLFTQTRIFHLIGKYLPRALFYRREQPEFCSILYFKAHFIDVFTPGLIRSKKNCTIGKVRRRLCKSNCSTLSWLIHPFTDLFLSPFSWEFIYLPRHHLEPAESPRVVTVVHKNTEKFLVSRRHLHGLVGTPVKVGGGMGQ